MAGIVKLFWEKIAKNHALRGVCLGLIVAVACLGLWGVDALTPWERVTWDLRAKVLAQPAKTTEKIKIVVLDQASLDWAKEYSGLGWPWPRQAYSHVINYLKRANAKAVIFDVLFTESSAIPDDDRSLAVSMKKAQNVFGAMMLTKDIGVGVWPKWILNKPTYLPQFSQISLENLAIQKSKALLPIVELGKSMVGLGNVAENPDSDQVVRRITMLSLFSGKQVLNLGTQAFVSLAKEKPMLAENVLKIKGRKIHLDNKGRAILRFRGGPNTHEKYSAASVIQSEIRIQQGQKPTIKDASVFKDCYVFFGFTAPGLHDLRATAVSPVFPGVEVQATALDNLLNGDFIRQTPVFAVILGTLLICGFAGLSGCLAQSALKSLMVFIAFLPIPLIFGLAAYELGYWWPVILGEVGVILTLLGSVVMNFALEGRQKRFIKKAFNHYLSPVVIDRILADPNQLALGGQRKELTIMFSDLAGFTSLSEGLDPQELTGLLNDYLSEMSEFILSLGGTLDKYEGDAIIAFWNAPLDQNDHAYLACKAALQCQNRLAQRADEYKERLGKPLWARIGLNTGDVVVGNMGSKTRFDYTVLGDAANLASRLEGANKVFGTPLMVSKATWDKVSDKLCGRKLGKLRVVGRTQPVEVFQPLGEKTEVDMAFVRAFENGVSLVEEKKYQKAYAVFAEISHDAAAKAYMEKIKKIDSDQQWDGVWNLTQK